jgi:hypothetical protein
MAPFFGFGSLESSGSPRGPDLESDTTAGRRVSLYRLGDLFEAVRPQTDFWFVRSQFRY